MPSYANVTPTNMELSPVQVVYNSVDLGGTLGNAVINVKYTKADIKADQFGSTVLDRKVSGLDITVTTELAEVKNKSTVQVIFPMATMHTSGSETALEWDSQVGVNDLSYAQTLTLHPLSITAGTVDYDHTFFLATASSESTITYGPTEQAKMKIIWNVLPDTTVTPARFYRYGNTTI